MAFTMHSHSGQFCPGHAKDELEEIVKRAISLNMRHIALTEHMPRTKDKDMYPEEQDHGLNPQKLMELYAAYLKEAARLRDKYASQIKILVGFECEWIRQSDAQFVLDLAKNPAVDLFLGSVHHMHQIPIDYDRAMYEQARTQSGGTDELLFMDYFDAQYDMLHELKPPVVAHFDLIRLFSGCKDQDLREMPAVWQKVVRNLEFIAGQDMIIEVNSSALRKGLKEPYPARAVCEKFIQLGGKFTLSDDSHGTAQVGLNFKRVQAYLLDVGIEKLWTFQRDNKGELGDIEVLVKDLQLDAHPSTD